MTEGYSSQQLDVFKTTLDILASAVLGTGQQKGWAGQRCPTDMAESDPVEESAAIAEAFETSFVSQPVEDIPVAGIAQGPTVAEFFQPLPWHKQADGLTEPSTVQPPFVQPQLIAANAPLETSAAYFSSLPWHQQSAGQISAPESVPTVVPHQAHSTAQTASTPFFAGLPWQQGKSTDFMAAMSNNDFASIANIATQTAIQAAQRSAVKNPKQGLDKADRFFQALPW